MHRAKARASMVMFTTLLLLGSPGCKDFGDPVEPASNPIEGEQFFNENVLPIFQNHCGLSGCHRTRRTG